MERFPKFFFGISDKGNDPPEYCCSDPFGHHGTLRRKGWTPNTDIYETAESIILLLDVSGVTKGDIQIVCRDDILRVSGVRTRTYLPGMERIHRIELDYGPFEKLFRIYRDLEVEKIAAEYENGLLQISIPKKKASEPMRIVIVHEE